MIAHTIRPLDFDGAVLKARLKAKLLGSDERVRLGRFELLRSCGQGGEGVVYEARDTASGVRVALKHLHRMHAAAGATLQREFRAVSRIVHPNLAVLYELFCVEAQWFYTMELLSGVNFVSAVRGAGEGDARHAALRAALIPLLRGVGAIHAAGKIHRDLKPGNVLMEPDGRVVILDYGLMIGPFAEGGWGAGQVVGTRAYMAPEQAAGAALTPAVDLYAVGAMLHEALTGRPPELAGRGDAAPSGRPSFAAQGGILDALCSDLLAVDPTRRPSAEQALTRLSGAGAAATHAPRAEPGTRLEECFVGRAAPLRALHTALHRARAGEASLVWVHGESGIGKSALLKQFCSELAEQTDVLVLSGRCYERESTPYKVFDGIVEALARFLDGLPRAQARALLPDRLDVVQRVFPALAGLQAAPAAEWPLAQTPPELCELAFSGVRELLRRIRAQRPLVLIIDDLQWGDSDSIRMLQRVLAPPEMPALLVVGAYRRDELGSSPFLQQALVEGVLQAPGCHTADIALDALRTEEALQLMRAAASCVGDWPIEQVEACVRAARGVPFVLRELTAHALSAARASGGPFTRDASLPASVTEVVALRVERCSSDARALLDVLCLAGHPLELTLATAAFPVLADAGGRPPGAGGRSAAVELCAAGLARWRDTCQERCLEPYHDLIRGVIAAGVSEERKQSVHAELARCMEALAIDQPERLFQHLLASGARARAGAMALEAGWRAGRALAWVRAADWFRAVLELVSEEEARNQQVHELLGHALSFAGQHRAAASAFLRGVAFESGAGGAKLERLAAQQLFRAGDEREANGLIEKVLRDVGLHYPARRWLAVAKCLAGLVERRVTTALPVKRRSRDEASRQRLEALDACYVEHWLSDPLRALVIHGWFVREGLRARDRHWQLALLAEAVLIVLAKGARGARQCARLMARVDASNAEPGEQAEELAVLYTRAVYLTHARGRPRDALAVIRAAERMVAESVHGFHVEHGWLVMLKDHALEVTGNFSELVEGVLRRERESLERDDGYSLRQLLVSLPAALLVQDRPDAALELVRARWVRSEHGAALPDFIAIMRRSCALLYRGDAQAAHASLLGEWEWLRRTGAFNSGMAHDQAMYYRARNAAALYAQTGARALKRDVQRRCWNAARAQPSVRGAFRLVQAGIARIDGRHAACRALLEAAGRDFRATQSDASEALVRYRLAQLDRSPAARAAARDWLAERGVRNVPRWVAIGSPGPEEW